MATTVVKAATSSTYTFSSQPKALQQTGAPRQKFRTVASDVKEDHSGMGNLMYDRRVIRGSTYALNHLPAHAQPDPIEIQRQEEAKRRALARRRVREQTRRRTPEPMAGRKNIDVQTELYLEELSDRVEEADVDVQTDAFLDRPLSPLFIPLTTGEDAATQIEKNDLFDFDLEVKPIVETLVGKTVEQALVEVSEEEELAAIREQQRRFEEVRNTEIIELQRLEEQERRLRAEKTRRMKQEEDKLQSEQEMARKISARAFAKAYVKDLIPSVFKNLRENGYFYDPIEHEVETSFMPWLMDQTMTQINRILLGRTILDSIIRDIVEKHLDDYHQLEEKLRQAVEEEQFTDTSMMQLSQQPEPTEPIVDGSNFVNEINSQDGLLMSNNMLNSDENIDLVDDDPLFGNDNDDN